MDKNEFKNFITCVVMAVALLLTIAASAGAMNYGAGAGNPSFYIVAGICNLGWAGLIGWLFYKRFIKKDDTASSGGEGASDHSATNSDNKTDEMKEGGR